MTSREGSDVNSLSPNFASGSPFVPFENAAQYLSYSVAELIWYIGEYQIPLYGVEADKLFVSDLTTWMKSPNCFKSKGSEESLEEKMGVYQRKNGTYEVRYRDHTGCQQAHNFGAGAEAERLAYDHDEFVKDMKKQYKADGKPNVVFQKPKDVSEPKDVYFEDVFRLYLTQRGAEKLLDGNAEEMKKFSVTLHEGWVPDFANIYREYFRTMLNSKPIAELKEHDITSFMYNKYRTVNKQVLKSRVKCSNKTCTTTCSDFAKCMRKAKGVLKKEHKAVDEYNKRIDKYNSEHEEKDWKKKKKKIPLYRKAGNGKRRYLSYIQVILNCGLNEGMIDRHPLQKWKKGSEEPRQLLLTPDLLRRIQQNAAPHIAWALEVAFNLGLRVGKSELFALKWEHVFWEQKKIRVYAPKTKKTRYIPLGDEFICELKKQRKKAVTEYIVEYEGHPIKRMNKGFKGACTRAGVDANVVPYEIRHLFASSLLGEHVDVVTLSKLLGHASVEQTMTYLHTNDEMKRDAIEKLKNVA